jgi:hypothetical protein
MRQEKMTKKHKKSTVLHRRHELYKTGYKIFMGQGLELEEREFIGRALCMIAEGANPAEELLVKSGKGEKNSKQAAKTENRNRMLIAAIMELRWPSEEGVAALTLEEAIAYIATDHGRCDEGEGPFAVTENNLRKVWQKYKDNAGFEETFSILPDD